MESVNMDIHLDIHERMIDSMGASLSKTKKRLYDAELTMNLRPSDNDPVEVEQWEEKVDSLISTRDRLLFPKLYMVKREHEEMAAVASKKKSVSIHEWNEKANETLINQIDHLQQRVLNRGEQHTSKQTGTIIRTINNYRGCNTYHQDSRTLIRKECTGYEPPDGSSLPPWFGPLYYYPKNLEYDPNTKHDNAYKMAFVSTARDTLTEERARREKIARRKQEIKNVTQQRLEQQQLEELNRPILSRSPSRLKDFAAGFRDDSQSSQSPSKSVSPPPAGNRKAPMLFLTEDSEGRGVSPPRHGGVSPLRHGFVDDSKEKFNAFEDACCSEADGKYINEKGKLVVDEEELSYIRASNARRLLKQNSSSGMSVGSRSGRGRVSIRGTLSPQHSIRSINSHTSGTHKLNSLGGAGSLAGRSQSTLNTSRSESYLHMPRRTTKDNLLERLTSPIRSPDGRASTRESRPSTVVRPEKSPGIVMNPRSNPLHSRNPFAIKLLGIHTGREPKRFQVKDFTRGAFITQQTSTSTVDISVPTAREMSFEYEEDSLDGMSLPGGARRGALTNDDSLVFTNSSINIKYSSPIFKAPNINYALPAVVMPKSAAKVVVEASSTDDTMPLEEKPIESLALEPVPVEFIPEPTVEEIVEVTQQVTPTATVPPPIAETPPPILSTPKQRKSERKSKVVIAPPISSPVPLPPSVLALMHLDPSSAGNTPTGTPFQKHRKSIREADRSFDERVSIHRRKTDIRVAKLLYTGRDQPEVAKEIVAAITTHLAAVDHANSPVVDVVKHPLNIDSSHFDLTTSINDWYAQNAVYAPTKEEMKHLRKKDDFLLKHAELPSIELSLNGLLLEENPYTKDSELIRKSIYGDRDV